MDKLTFVVCWLCVVCIAITSSYLISINEKLIRDKREFKLLFPVGSLVEIKDINEIGTIVDNSYGYIKVEGYNNCFSPKELKRY